MPLVIPRFNNTVCSYLLLNLTSWFLHLWGVLTPDVEEAFGPSPIPKTSLSTLIPQEERRIKFWVRIIAVMLIAESLVDNIFSDWFRSHGFPAGGKVNAVFEVIASLGLLFFRQNIGRGFGLFLLLYGAG